MEKCNMAMTTLIRSAMSTLKTSRSKSLTPTATLMLTAMSIHMGTSSTVILMPKIMLRLTLAVDQTHQILLL